MLGTRDEGNRMTASQSSKRRVRRAYLIRSGGRAPRACAPDIGIQAIAAARIFNDVVRA
jgi:hypothetical protein